MANKKMNLSREGKDILDTLVESLDVDRPTAIKISLAKGIALSINNQVAFSSQGGSKWTIPENIIKGDDYLLFKHLIINELERPLTDEELNKYMLQYIEYGLQEINNIIQNKSTMEDLKISLI